MNIKNIFTLALIGVSTLVTPVTGHADTQVVSTADQSIVKKISYDTVNKNDARKNEDVKIRVDFSEDFRNQIKPGDKLVFKLPPELKAVNKTIPLEQDGKGIFGNVVITNGQAVLEFNDKVKAYDHIQGFFEIGTRVIVDIAEDTTLEIPMNLGTSLDVHKLTIANPKTGNNPNPLGYKGGEQDIDDPEHIKWWLVLNSSNAQVLSDMVVTDKVGKGHKLVPETLTLNGKPYKQAEADGDIIIHTLDETGFKITVKQDKVVGSFNYKTKINADAIKQKEMPNHFKIEGRAEGYTDQVWEGDRVVKNLLALNGGIDGDQHEEHATEGVEEMPEEGVTETKDPEEHAKESEIPNSTHVLDTKKPLTEQEIQLIEEVLTEDQFETLQEIMDEHLDGSVEKNHTHEVDVNGDVMILTDAELLEEILAPEQFETLKELIEEHGSWGVIEKLFTPEMHTVDIKRAPKANEQATKHSAASTKQTAKVANEATDKADNAKRVVNQAQALPKTGYNNGFVFVLLGLFALIGTVAIFFKKSKGSK